MTINFLWKSDNIVHATMDGGGMLKTIMNSKYPYLSITLNFFMNVDMDKLLGSKNAYIKSKLGDLKFN